MYLCDHQNDNVCTQQMFEPNSTNNHRFLSPTDNNVFPLPFLPSELIVEILLRLSARCLLKFRRVCKLWKTLISDPKFAKKHLLISIADPSISHQRLAFHNCSYPLKALFENPSVRVIPDRFNGLENDDQEHYVLGSCNGFLCIFDSHDCNMIMYNPSIGLKSQSSPKINYLPDWWMEYIGFGYDQVSDKYKVLVVECRDPNLDEEFGESLTKIYTFGEDSWRTIQDLPGPLTEDLGKYVSGTLNWIGIRHLIISFDMNKETYRDVLLPQNIIFEGGFRNKCSLYVLNDCLCFCFVNKTHFVVWLMKEYGVIESWAKLMTIPCENLIFKNFVNQFSNIELLFISENGVVLLMVSNQICLYNLNSGMLDHSFISINTIVSDDPVIYCENLISPRW